MKKILAVLFLMACGLCCSDGAEPDATRAILTNAVRAVVMDTTKPIFVPTHHRVTTTVRFPKEVGAPMGASFTEDPEKNPGEYVISWVPGEQYFTVTPLEGAGPANLNVPVQGQICVLYFYPVATQAEASAYVNVLERPQQAGAGGGPQPEPVQVKRQAELPPSEFLPVTSARLMGLMDKLKVIHAVSPGPELEGFAKSMSLDVAVSRAETEATPGLSMQGVSGVIQRPTSDGGLYQIVLVRAVRDRRLNCLGFIVLLRNVSRTPIAIDTASFCARTGANLLPQVLADSPAVLSPGDQREAYIICQAPKGLPILAENEWRLSVELLSPRLNPGAAIAAKFGQEREAARKESVR